MRSAARCARRGGDHQAVIDADWIAAHRADALFNAHHDDAESGYRFLADKARDAGQPMADRTAWRLFSTNRWWSVFGKPKAYSGPAEQAPPPTTTTSDGTSPRWRRTTYG